VRQKALQEAEAKKADFQARYLGALPGTGSLDDRIGAARTQLSQIDSRTWRRRRAASARSTARWRARRERRGRGGGPTSPGRRGRG
jgi:hypothetical protein